MDIRMCTSADFAFIEDDFNYALALKLFRPRLNIEEMLINTTAKLFSEEMWLSLLVIETNYGIPVCIRSHIKYGEILKRDSMYTLLNLHVTRSPPSARFLGWIQHVYRRICQ